MSSFRVKLPASTWWLLAAATVTATLLLLFPFHLFPRHDVSIASLPVLALALVAGPVAGALGAVAVVGIALALHSLTTLLAMLLLAAPLLGLPKVRQLHPAYACVITPLAAALVNNLLAAHGTERLHLLTIDLLQAAISVIFAFGFALLFSARFHHGSGGWAGRPLTHRLFVMLSTVATLLMVGLGLLSVTNMQERQVQNALSNLQLLSLEIAESSQILLRAHGRSLSAFGRSLTVSNLDEENDDLSARVAAYAASQLELLTVLVVRADGDVIAAAATKPTLDTRAVLLDNVADREYFRGAVQQGAPYVTDTFRGRGFGSDIIVGISAPIYRAEQLVGVIEGSLNLQQLAQVLDSASSRRGLDIVLVDRANRVVAARGAVDLKTGQLFVRPQQSITEADLSHLHISELDDRAQLAASARRQPYGWTVQVAQPLASLAPAFETQFRMVVRDMSIALLVVFTLSIVFAGVMARPLGQFAQALNEESAGGARLLRSVRSAPREIRRFALVLVRAQRRQRRSLRRQQQLVTEKDRLNQELQQLNVELDQIVEARTRVLAERERQLRSSETRWRTMAEIAPDAVVVIDEDNVIQFVNSRLVEMTGCAPDEMVGKSLDVMIPDRLRNAHHHGLQRYLRTHRRNVNWRASEAIVRRADGTEQPVEIAFGEYTLEGRHYFAGYLRDITARKQHEADVIRARDLAEAANRSKDAFLATMSHEIRTPLHGLIGTLDLMAREELGERLAYRLNIARNSARSLLQIANDVLDLSGIEAGRVRIEKVAFDLRDLVSAVCTSFEPGALEKGLRLEHEIGQNVPGWVEGDPLRLRQIIANLVNNAIKFTPRGRVALRVRRDGERIVFDVVDTGIGVPLDKREHIFDRFAQAEDERTRRFGGAGLGLAISRLLARAMGGDLTLAETGPLGSTFRLMLPLHEAAAQAQSDASGTIVKVQKPLFDPAHPPRVLVIDDNPANRYVVEAYLHELGAIAVLADGADAGIGELVRGAFDLVLMDVQMPGKDGYQATREIRTELGLTALPIVAMTANANIGERGRCEEAGMNDLLVKPFDVPHLVDTLNRNLAIRTADARPAGANAAAADGASVEPIIDTTSAGSIVQRFAGKPSTLRKLYSALQESITMHLEAIRLARAENSPLVAATLHGLKGASGMYGARRLQVEAKALEADVIAGTAVADLAERFDRLDRTGRETVDAVAKMLESLAATVEDTARS